MNNRRFVNAVPVQASKPLTVRDLLGMVPDRGINCFLCAGVNVSIAAQFMIGHIAHHFGYLPFKYVSIKLQFFKISYYVYYVLHYAGVVTCVEMRCYSLGAIFVHFKYLVILKFFTIYILSFFPIMLFSKKSTHHV